MTHAIETKALTRRFGQLDAVQGLTLSVPERSVFALVGPNGAGKTTTIKLLMNLVQPTSGAASVLGVDSRRLGPRELARIGYVSESQHMPDWLTPDQLLDYVRPFHPTWDDKLCRKLRDDLSLTANTPLRKLSRGTRMKAALLASLAYRPELIVLDEPFTGLDPMVRDDLIRALLELPGDRPCTMLISSHDIDEVERLADWVGFIQNGRLALAEPVDSLLKRFRLIEVVAADDQVAPPSDPRWLVQGQIGRLLRFIDTDHARPDAMTHITAMFPGADVRDAPLSLREIFVALARRAAHTEGA